MGKWLKKKSPVKRATKYDEKLAATEASFLNLMKAALKTLTRTAYTRKMKPLNPYKFVGTHPYLLDVPVTLKWYRGASRYNNGAYVYSRQYRLRKLVSCYKQNTPSVSDCNESN